MRPEQGPGEVSKEIAEATVASDAESVDQLAEGIPNPAGPRVEVKGDRGDDGPLQVGAEKLQHLHPMTHR